MKFLLFSLITTLLSISNVFANQTDTRIYGSWVVAEYADQMDDSISCILTYNPQGKTFFFLSKISTGEVALMEAGGYAAIGIKYRADKKEPKQIGYSSRHSFSESTYEVYGRYAIEGDELVEFINDLLAADSVFAEFYPKNRYAYSDRREFNMSKFDEALADFLSCNKSDIKIN